MSKESIAIQQEVEAMIAQGCPVEHIGRWFRENYPFLTDDADSAFRRQMGVGRRMSDEEMAGYVLTRYVPSEAIVADLSAMQPCA